MALIYKATQFKRLTQAVDKVKAIFEFSNLPAQFTGDVLVLLDGSFQFDAGGAGRDFDVTITLVDGIAPTTGAIGKTLTGPIQCALNDVRVLATALNVETWDFTGDGKNDIEFADAGAGFTAPFGTPTGFLTLRTKRRNASQDLRVDASIATHLDYGMLNVDGIAVLGSTHATWVASNIKDIQPVNWASQGNPEYLLQWWEPVGANLP